jgi:hypothetical protein
MLAPFLAFAERSFHEQISQRFCRIGIDVALDRIWRFNGRVARALRDIEMTGAPVFGF